jgi:8-oxo-dGTP pyrophosphatase MutT (NUDIX family)
LIIFEEENEIMYKAFINDKPLIIEDVYSGGLMNSGYDVLSDSEFDFDDVVQRIAEKNCKGVLFLSASPLQAWHDFTGRYILMEAAGGVVKNNNEEILVIFRKKRWDLPKGKLDYGETPESAALREIREETGVHDLEIKGNITTTFHTYSEKEKYILKKTHWYSIRSGDTGELEPQQEEGIEIAKWMNSRKISDKVFENTYESIKEVLNEYFKKEI